MIRRSLALILALPFLLAANSPAPALSAYVGKYPFDKVQGIAFTRHPVVVRQVQAAVQSSAIQSRVLDPDSTAGSIARQGDFIVSWACEPHNCGFHHWSIVLTGSGRKAAVCYYNEDLTAGARWFVDGSVRFVDSEGNCEVETVPAAVALMLVQ